VVAAGAPVPRQNKTIISVGAIEVISGPHASQKFPLQAGETRIGRQKDRGCDVVLDSDHEISSSHGSVIVTNDGHLIYKDGSSNGSLVDGKPIHHNQCELQSGSQIEMGVTMLRVTLRVAQPAAAAGPVVTSTATAETPTPASPRSAPTIAINAQSLQSPQNAPAAATVVGFGAELEASLGPEAGRRFAVTRTSTTIGREDCDILLADESVSRRHATLRVSDGRYVLQDETSTHGTHVNGDPVPPDGRELVNGDRITFGKGNTVLLFHAIGS
jgi:pSer/pThr/pTyr-binding forkhead associated (FHA) protein